MILCRFIFLWYNHGMWNINVVCFFSTKTMGIIKIHFGHYVGKYSPWYWSGISPLQLGIVLVHIIYLPLSMHLSLSHTPFSLQPHPMHSTVYNIISLYFCLYCVLVEIMLNIIKLSLVPSGFKQIIHRHLSAFPPMSVGKKKRVL